MIACCFSAFLLAVLRQLLRKRMFKSLPKARLSRHIERLNLLSSGAGSVTVPAEVKSVELIFKMKTPDGHMGPRRFWKENLPRVQFHNPELPISVVRIEPEQGEFKKVPALLKINFQDGTTKQADVKHKHSSEILEEFIKLTNAQPAEEVRIEQ